MKNTENWYCLAENGELYFLGRFDSYEAADYAAEKQGYAALWLIDEKSADKWRNTLQKA